MFPFAHRPILAIVPRRPCIIVRRKTVAVGVPFARDKSKEWRLFIELVNEKFLERHEVADFTKRPILRWTPFKQNKTCRIFCWKAGQQNIA